MRKRTWLTLASLVMVAVLQTSGCSSIIPPIPVTIGLGSTLGTIDVVDGTGETQGTATFDTSSVPGVSGGTIELDPSVISIQPASGDGAGKASVAYQLPADLAAACSGEPLLITVWIGTTEQVDTVFDDGEQYGPFEVTLDEDCVPVSVSPTSVTLSSTTVALFESGNISLGIRAESPVDGTIVINNLNFTIRISL
ncbi:MAG: hypothetical protein JSU63_15860 [Phycisphaerales bacterium]|nr:MAG: hypothetical protein JSU63_15860 [Phycisphaerales bacterium]